MNNQTLKRYGNMYTIFSGLKEKKVFIELNIVQSFSNTIEHLDLNITFSQSVWLSWVVLFRAPAKINSPKGFTSKFMANIWACFCLAFMASYTANLGFNCILFCSLQNLFVSLLQLHS